MSDQTPPRAAPYDTHPNFPFPAAVTLSCTVTVNGEEMSYQQLVPRPDWDVISSDPVMRAGYERQIRRALAETVVERLALPVTVRLPTPR